MLVGLEAFTSQPVHRHNAPAGLEYPVDLAEELPPIAVVTRALDIDDSVHRFVDERQALRAIGERERDPVIQARIAYLFLGYLELRPADVDARDGTSRLLHQMHGGPADPASRVHDVIAHANSSGGRDDVDHSLHGTGKPRRAGKGFTFLRALARLEQPEMYVIGVPSPDVESRCRSAVVLLDQVLVVRNVGLLAYVQFHFRARGSSYDRRYHATANPIKPVRVLMAYREQRFTSNDGLSLYFRDYGDPGSAATPVLCLAGLFRNARDFDLFARRLAEERRVLCPDLRGRGRSDYDPDWRNYRPATYLSDISQLLAIAKVHKVVVVGTSFGGLLAMAFGAFMPLALAGIVLNDAGPEVDQDGLDHILSYISVDRPQPDWKSAAKAVKTQQPGAMFQSEAMFEEMVRSTYRKGEDGLLHFDWDVNIVKPIIETRGTSPDLWPYFRGLHPIPLLAFRGAVSELFSEECFLRMGREYPAARLVTVPGTGHAPTLTEPECLAALDAFLCDL